MKEVSHRMSHQVRHRIAASLLFACLLLSGTQSGFAQQAKVVAAAADDYARYCAACHGAAGHGDGELAAKLVMPPSDLTRITERNGGFPFWRVYDIIASEQPVPGHDTFQMPQFAARLNADESKPGYLPAHIRILLLTHYLESLQAP